MTRSEPEPHSRVSVVIPAYNAAETIRNTIESALAQTHNDVEIIVVDDGSCDNTREITRSFGTAVLLLEQENLGPGAARNYGVAVAEGEWIAFLDADDTWTPDKLSEQLARARDSHAELIYTNVKPVGDTEELSALQHDPGHMPEGQVLAALQLDNFITLSSVMIRRVAFEALGGFRPGHDVRGAEDWDLWLRYAESGRSVSACGKPLVYYRWSSGSLSNSVSRMHSARLAVLEHHAQLMGEKSTTGSMLKAKSRAYSCSAWAARRDKRWLSYLRFTLGAWCFAIGQQTAKLARRKSKEQLQADAKQSGMITNICRKAVAGLGHSVRDGYYPVSDRAAIAPVVGVLLVLAAKYEDCPEAEIALSSIRTCLSTSLHQQPGLQKYVDTQLQNAPELRQLLDMRAETIQGGSDRSITRA